MKSSQNKHQKLLHTTGNVATKQNKTKQNNFNVLLLLLQHYTPYRWIVIYSCCYLQCSRLCKQLWHRWRHNLPQLPSRKLTILLCCGLWKLRLCSTTIHNTTHTVHITHKLTLLLPIRWIVNHNPTLVAFSRRSGRPVVVPQRAGHDPLPIFQQW